MPGVEVAVPRYLRNVGESPTPDEFTVSGISALSKTLLTFVLYATSQ